MFVRAIKTLKKNDKSILSTFIIEPVKIGESLTIANALRRIILNEFFSHSISDVRINNISTELDTVYGIREDVLEILLNFKNIIFKNSLSNKYKNYRGYILQKGPCIITAGMFKLPKTLLSIINPEQYICTVNDKVDFYAEVIITQYSSNSYLSFKKNSFKNKLETAYNFNFIEIKEYISPIKKINYKTRLVYDDKGFIKESIILDLMTNGSITPLRVLKESLKIFSCSLSNIFIDLNLIKNF